MAKLDKKQSGLRALFREASLAHNFTFKIPRGTKSFTPAQQGAIKRAHNRVFENQGYFLREIRSAKKENRLPEVEIFKLKRRQRQRFENVAGGNINNKALFVKVPAVRNRKRKPKVTLNKSGTVSIKTGALRQVYIQADPVDILRGVVEPGGIRQKILDIIGTRRKPQSLSFSYDGFISNEAKDIDTFVNDLEKYLDSVEDIEDTFQFKRVTGLVLNYVR